VENKNSPAKIKAIHKYDKKTYDKMGFRVKKGNRQLVETLAKERNLSINGLINKLLADAIGDDFKL